MQLIDHCTKPFIPFILPEGVSTKQSLIDITLCYVSLYIDITVNTSIEIQSYLTRYIITYSWYKQTTGAISHVAHNSNVLYLFSSIKVIWYGLFFNICLIDNNLVIIFHFINEYEDFSLSSLMMYIANSSQNSKWIFAGGFVRMKIPFLVLFLLNQNFISIVPTADFKRMVSRGRISILIYVFYLFPFLVIRKKMECFH